MRAPRRQAGAGRSGRRQAGVRQVGVVWGSAVLLAVLALVLIDACSAGSSAKAHPSTPSTRPAEAEDLVMTAADFHNIHTMTRVRGFFVDNRLGHLPEALRVADSPTGGTYPVGTVIQLVPQEAMVKRRAGFSPSTHDWEFFSLQTTKQGTVILHRGTNDVVNRFGGTCASCHGAAQARFDMVCEHSHGCAPLPIGDDVIALIQRADPRPLAGG